MKNGVVSIIMYLGLSTALTPSPLSAVPGISNFSSSESANSDVAAAPPPPVPGESAGQWIDQLFDNSSSNTNDTSDSTFGILGSAFVYGSSINVNTATVLDIGSKKRKRDYEEGYGLHASVWSNVTTKFGYNISVDFSNCSTGLRYSTDIGVYTFTNGTTSNNTTLRAMVADLWSLRHSISTLNTHYANHTVVVAQQAMDEANQLLNNGLICQKGTASANSTAVDTTGETTGEIIHTELRKLLSNAWSYWASVILSAGVGATFGASIAAGMDARFKGNVTAQNTIQTGTVVAVTILIAGILNRMHEVGHLDNAERIPGAAQAVAANAVQQLVPGGREAIIQNVFIANARRAIQRIASRQAHLEEALSEAGVSVPGSPREAVDEALDDIGISVLGTQTSSATGTVDALDHPLSPDAEVCLDDIQAAEAAEAVGQMSDTDLGLETKEEIQERLAGHDEDGDCGV